ncbi:MAG: cbb3-type cytochrome c oxidase subunit I [Gammaproteobacteria bacterium]|nr:cbb3-type cytochrome c oxidase subunit I [Gammaproteobacteria bacterium]
MSPLNVSTGAAVAAARRWFDLGIVAFIASGIFAILLVLARTPGVSEWIPWVDAFHVALVVHVDLSMLIWFVALAGVLWSLGGGERAVWASNAGAALSAAGTALVIAAPFLDDGEAYTSDYILVLDQPLFLCGLGLIAAGFAVSIVRALLCVLARSAAGAGTRPIRLGMFLAALAGAAALAAIAIAGVLVPRSLPGAEYYQQLFWGGGHVLQFAHTLLMLVVWLILADAARLRLRGAPVWHEALLVLVFLPALAMPFGYLAYGVTGTEHRDFFTHVMVYGGLATVPMCLITAAALLARGQRPAAAERTAVVGLACSVGFFVLGGLLGFVIRGANVIIPAHYHGSLMGITLAYMALTYHLLPRLGYERPVERAAVAQLWLYSAGQLLHVLGLAWSGGYGVKRKVAGSAQVLDRLPEILGMGMMGLGGVIAIAGGMLFLAVALHAMWPRWTGRGGRRAAGTAPIFPSGPDRSGH